jgi:hypothetical protein
MLQDLWALGVLFDYGLGVLQVFKHPLLNPLASMELVNVLFGLTLLAVLTHRGQGAGLNFSCYDARHFRSELSDELHAFQLFLFNLWCIIISDRGKLLILFKMVVQKACGKPFWLFPGHIKDLKGSCFLIFIQGNTTSTPWLLEKEELLLLIFDWQATRIGIK